MAILLFRKRVEALKDHASDPANFADNLYQPEKYSTGEKIHHCEDHNYLLKHCFKAPRRAYSRRRPTAPQNTLHDPSSGLTYEALTRRNKQSVPDCERLISPGVISFLEQNGHTSNARIIKHLHKWHKAVHGRGLTEMQRSSYCKEMKDWLLSDGIPWYHYMPDYTLIDVNR